MKKKTWLIAAFALTLILCLTACGKGSGGGSDASSAASSSASTADAPSAPKGETVDAGDFTVFVPDGWLGIVQTNPFGAKDAQGNYPVRSDAYAIIKGGESEWDALSMPTVYIYLTQGDAQENSRWGTSWYDDVKEIDVSINGTQCYAFEVHNNGTEPDNPGYTYHTVFYPLDHEHFFQFNIPVDMEGEPAVSATDPDVVKIMESVTMK